MTIHVDRITVAAPTLSPITLGTGGSLAVGTTYYYRIIALRSYGGRYALSEASAEQSVTPTSGNQTAQLSWSAVADATAYIIQRTTTPGSYPVEGANTFNLNGQAYSGYPYATTMTSLNDDGGAASNIQFNSNNLDFDTEHPIIEVYADAVSEVVTLWDIANALAGGGFNDVQLLGSTPLQAGSLWREQGAYTLRGHLYIRDCTYRQRGPLLGLPGDLCLKSNSVIVQIGDPTVNYSPIFLHLGMPRIPYTSNNSTYAGNYQGGWSAPGKSGYTNTIRMFLERFISYNNVGNYAAIITDKYGGYGSMQYVDLIDSIVGLSNSGISYYPTDGCKNNIWESAVLMGGLMKDAIVRFGDNINLYFKNSIVQRCITRDMKRDFRIFYGYAGASVIDHLCKSQGQGDNQPYILVYKTTGAIRTVIFSVTRNFLVLDNNGDPLQGATITALNANGLSAFWEDSLATFSTALDAVTDPASLTVSDGTKFNENDYILCECYGEVLKVTGIAGNVLTVARAQLGTAMRATDMYYNPRVLKMVASVTTDANGEVNCAEPTLQRELYSVSGSGEQTDYEDALIANGYLGRNFYGPYALQISKAGYQTYEYPLLDPDVEKYPLGPATLEVALIPPPLPTYVNVPGGEVDITLAAPAALSVALEAAEITVELSDG